MLREVILRFAFCAAACAVITTSACPAGDEDSLSAFHKATELTDIRSAGSPAFELDAKAEIRGSNGTLIPGVYKLIWGSPSQWREELSFSGYSRIRVGGDERYWQQRSLDYEPLQITELGEALDFISALQDEKSPGKLKTRKESGGLLECAEGSAPRKRNYCFQASDGALVFEDAPGPTDFQFVYSDFRVFQHKRFPGKIEVSVGKTTYADVSVERLGEIGAADPSEFVPPHGSSLWLTCSNPERPHLIHSVNPVYPSQEKFAHHQGTVTMYVLIAEDGSVKSTQVLEAPSNQLANAALAAVRQWRYEPRRCGGAATLTETTVHVIFALGG